MARHGAAVFATVLGTPWAVSALGSVPGLSGSGMMTGLAAAGRIVGGGAAQGPFALALAPTAVSVLIMRRVLRDDQAMSTDERAARRAGRLTCQAAAPVALVASTAAIAVAGTAGASGAGIMSGLAAVGAGSALAGATIMVSLPVVAVAGVGTVTYVGWRTVQKRRKPDQGDDTAEDHQLE